MVSMSCVSCASGNQAEFPSEMIIHFDGLKNADNPGVWVFPKILVCLDCGFSQFSVPESDVALLARGTRIKKSLSPVESVDDTASPREVSHSSS